MLGIDAGEYDVRVSSIISFLNVLELVAGVEENAAINYDWYHPQLCATPWKKCRNGSLAPAK